MVPLELDDEPPDPDEPLGEPGLFDPPQLASVAIDRSAKNSPAGFIRTASNESWGVIL